ncbi:MAG: lipocalin family protein [Pseudomonadota bacterium]
MSKFQSLVAVMVAVAGLSGCASTADLGPIRTEQKVDLERFMGDWYVIAAIPTFIEKKAYNAIESYELREPGIIDTTFSFRKGGFDGKAKKYTPVGFVRDDGSNAIWGMRFVWPIKAEYRIVYLNEDYTQTVIGRTKRDYVWIMSRTPEMPPQDYEAIKAMLIKEGYDLTKLRVVPHRYDDDQ